MTTFQLQIHNTLTGRKEAFVPPSSGPVRIYVCGITPYDVCHLGHARCYVVFDVVRRVFKALGHPVRYVQNFTDVDDKIIARARERGVAPSQLARQNIDDFFVKMDALGVARAEVYPKVTEHIPEIIALIQRLVDRGAAYPLDGDVYFAVKAFPAYGRLSRKPLADLQAGARVDVNERKRDPLDFALWKAAKPEEPAEVSWDSPWGKGRPGWHIECSAMSLKHLGGGFDVHGGGLDLIFPHHENEIAQSEAAAGSPFARVWIHNGFVTVNREKMSKSLGNFFSLEEIFKAYHPAVVRYMLLTVHYRSPLDFSSDLLDQSRQSLSGLKDAIARATYVTRRQATGVDVNAAAEPEVTQAADAALTQALQALADDFNTPGALAEIHKLVSLLERQFQSNTVAAANVRTILETLSRVAETLGIDVFPRSADVLIPPEVSDLAERRVQARKARDFAAADRLRQQILERGFVVEDTAQGQRILPKAAF